MNSHTIYENQIPEQMNRRKKTREKKISIDCSHLNYFGYFMPIAIFFSFFHIILFKFLIHFIWKVLFLFFFGCIFATRIYEVNVFMRDVFIEKDKCHNFIVFLTQIYLFPLISITILSYFSRYAFCDIECMHFNSINTRFKNKNRFSFQLFCLHWIFF